MRLVEKLKLKTDAPLWLLNAPADVAPFFDMLEVKKTLTGKAAIGQALYFAADREDLEAGIATLINRLAPDALVWIAHPKKSSRLYTNLHRDEGWDSVEGAGYTGVASIAVTDDWSAIRFKKKDAIKTLLRDTPMEARVTEGIDYKNKTVQLPADAVAAMKAHKGLEAFFNSMAYSHKKEYVEAIVEAKKPETRERRIKGMIAMMLQLQAKKEQQAKQQ